MSRHFGPLAWSETRHTVTLWSQVRWRKLAATWPRYVSHCRQAGVLSELSFASFRLKIWTGVSVDCHRRQGNVCSVKSIHRPLIAWLLLWCEFKSLRPSDAYMHEQFYHYWFRQWLGAWSAPRRYLKQCWDIVNLTLRKKLQWHFNRNSYIFIQEHAFENVTWKFAAILSQPQCVNAYIPFDNKYLAQNWSTQKLTANLWGTREQLHNECPNY